MQMDPGTVLAIILALVTFVAWLVRLEGRITRADEMRALDAIRTEERLSEYKRWVEDRHATLSKDFYRLRDKIDGGKYYVFNRSPDRDGGEHG